MRSREDLTVLQLQIVMSLANGMTLKEIAKSVDRSISHIKQQSDKAREKMGARTLPQLVSIVIAQGLLEWQKDHRVINGDHLGTLPGIPSR
jgi:DNA-binding NarL/FixJ family response regulator